MKTFSVSVITPKETIWEGTATSLRAPGVLGNFGIWANHAPFITELEEGEIMIRTPENDTPLRYKVNGGFLQVQDNKVIALPDRVIK